MTINSDADGVTWIEFSKYKIKNYKVDQIDLFDVTTEGLLNLPPDFDEGKPLFHKYHCISLLRNAANYHSSQLLPFLDHQFGSLKYPDRWLRSFDSLLHLNKTYFLSISSKDKYKVLRRCINERLTLLNNMVREEGAKYSASTEDRARFNMKKVKEDLKSVRGFENKKNILLRWRADYFQDVEENPKAKFIRDIDIEIGYITATKNSIEKESKIEKTIFDDSAAQLASLLGQLLKAENKNGLVFRGSTNPFIKAVCNAVTDNDGKPFVENTIIRNITEFNAGTLSKKNKIDLDLDLDTDKESP